MNPKNDGGKMCSNLQIVIAMFFSKQFNSFTFNSLEHKFPKNKDNSTNGSQASFGSNPSMEREQFSQIEHDDHDF